MLWYPENLGVGQGYEKAPRDEALLKDLATKLGVPNERFIGSDESKNISAQQYLMAMLELLEPLSVMFKDIWNYCERTMTKSSKNAVAISWDFNIQGKCVSINFESFRLYERLRAGVADKDSFNRLCNGFASACTHYPRDGRGKSAGLPPRPTTAMHDSVASRIYDLCATVLELTEDGYWGTADAVPALWTIYKLPVWDRSAFTELRPLLEQAEPNLKPEDILELPFWRQRWQIYELWCLVTTLQLFERRGFELARSPSGASLLELGHKVIIAERKSDPLGQIVYQASYQRREGSKVQPDVVVVRGESGAIRPDKVAAIIECKQQRMPDESKLKLLKKRYFDDAAEMYADAVADDGKLVLLNYDSVDFEHRYTLISEFRPETRHALEAPLADVLAFFSPTDIQPQPVLIIDGSSSMESVRAALTAEVERLHRDICPSSDVVFLASCGPVQMGIDRVCEAKFSGSESAELFAQGMRVAKEMHPASICHVITDLDSDSTIISDFLEECASIPVLHYL